MTSAINLEAWLREQCAEYDFDVRGVFQARCHIYEGQRKHAELLGDRFRLIVVFQIDVRRDTHQVRSCAGPIGEDKGTLQAASWTGVLTG